MRYRCQKIGSYAQAQELRIPAMVVQADVSLDLLLFSRRECEERRH
jgi:hypothetical protein